jgi:hypothetical protein
MTLAPPPSMSERAPARAADRRTPTCPSGQTSSSGSPCGGGSPLGWGWGRGSPPEGHPGNRGSQQKECAPLECDFTREAARMRACSSWDSWALGRLPPPSTRPSPPSPSTVIRPAWCAPLSSPSLAPSASSCPRSEARWMPPPSAWRPRAPRSPVWTCGPSAPRPSSPRRPARCSTRWTGWRISSLALAPSMRRSTPSSRPFKGCARPLPPVGTTTKPRPPGSIPLDGTRPPPS